MDSVDNTNYSSDEYTSMESEAEQNFEATEGVGSLAAQEHRYHLSPDLSPARSPSPDSPKGGIARSPKQVPQALLAETMKKYRRAEQMVRELRSQLTERESTASLAAEVGQQLLKQIDDLKALNNGYNDRIKLLEQERLNLLTKRSINADSSESIVEADEAVVSRLRELQKEISQTISELGPAIPSGVAQRQQINRILDHHGYQEEEAPELTYNNAKLLNALRLPIGSGQGIFVDLLYASELCEVLTRQLQQFASRHLYNERQRAILESVVNDHVREVDQLKTSLKRAVEMEGKHQETAWELEVSNQDLKSRLQQALMDGKRLVQELQKQQLLSANFRERVEVLEEREKEQTALQEKSKLRHEQDAQALRKTIANLQRDKKELEKRLEKFEREEAATNNIKLSRKTEEDNLEFEALKRKFADMQKTNTDLEAKCLKLSQEREGYKTMLHETQEAYKTLQEQATDPHHANDLEQETKRALSKQQRSGSRTPKSRGRSRKRDYSPTAMPQKHLFQELSEVRLDLASELAMARRHSPERGEQQLCPHCGEDFNDDVREPPPAKETKDINTSPVMQEKNFSTVETQVDVVVEEKPILKDVSSSPILQPSPPLAFASVIEVQAKRPVSILDSITSPINQPKELPVKSYESISVNTSPVLEPTRVKLVDTITSPVLVAQAVAKVWETKAINTSPLPSPVMLPVVLPEVPPTKPEVIKVWETRGVNTSPLPSPVILPVVLPEVPPTKPEVIKVWETRGVNTSPIPSPVILPVVLPEVSPTKPEVIKVWDTKGVNTSPIPSPVIIPVLLPKEPEIVKILETKDVNTSPIPSPVIAKAVIPEELKEEIQSVKLYDTKDVSTSPILEPSKPPVIVPIAILDEPKQVEVVKTWNDQGVNTLVEAEKAVETTEVGSSPIIFATKVHNETAEGSTNTAPMMDAISSPIIIENKLEEKSMKSVQVQCTTESVQVGVQCEAEDDKKPVLFNQRLSAFEILNASEDEEEQIPELVQEEATEMAVPAPHIDVSAIPAEILSEQTPAWKREAILTPSVNNRDSTFVRCPENEELPETPESENNLKPHKLSHVSMISGFTVPLPDDTDPSLASIISRINEASTAEFFPYEPPPNSMISSPPPMPPSIYPIMSPVTDSKGKLPVYFANSATQTDPAITAVKPKNVDNSLLPPRPATKPPAILLVRSAQAAPVLIRRAEENIQAPQPVEAEAGTRKSVYGTSIIGEIGKGAEPTTIPKTRVLPILPSKSPKRQSTPSGEAISAASGLPTTTDPLVIQAITQTMIGDHLWKYTRHLSGATSERKHRRFFWIHPYTKTIYWCVQAPGIDGKSNRDATAKSAHIKSVRVALEPCTETLSMYIIIISTPGRELKIRAENDELHSIWLRALSYLQSRPAVVSSHDPLDDKRVPNGDTAIGAAEPLTGISTNVNRLLKQKRSLSNLFARRESNKEDEYAATIKASELNVISRRVSQPVATGSGGAMVAEEEDDNIRACCGGKHDLDKLCPV